MAKDKSSRVAHIVGCSLSTANRIIKGERSSQTPLGKRVILACDFVERLDAEVEQKTAAFREKLRSEDV